jgi:hypothetical protein
MAPEYLGTKLSDCRLVRIAHAHREAVMGRGILLWLIGIPIPIIILLLLFLD